LLRNFLTTVNEMLDDMLPLLYPSVQARLKIVLNDTNKRPVTLEASPRRYGQFSSGEKRRLDFVIRLALIAATAKHLGVRTNYMVVDEFLDPIDRTGREAITEALEAFALQESKAVYLVTQDVELRSKVSNRIRIEKSDGESRVEKC